MRLEPSPGATATAADLRVGANPERRHDAHPGGLANQDPNAGLALVLCQLGADQVGFEAVLVRQALIAHHTGQAGGAATLEARLGLEITSREDRRLLHLHTSHGDWHLDVAGPIELANVPIGQIHPLPPLLALNPPLPGLRAFALAEDHGRAPWLILLLDPEALAPRPGAHP